MRSFGFKGPNSIRHKHEEIRKHKVSVIKKFHNHDSKIPLNCGSINFYQFLANLTVNIE